MDIGQIGVGFHQSSILLSMGQMVLIGNTFWYFLVHHLDDMDIVLEIDHNKKALVLVLFQFHRWLNPFSNECSDFGIVEHEPMVGFSFKSLKNILPIQNYRIWERNLKKMKIWRQFWNKLKLFLFLDSTSCISIKDTPVSMIHQWPHVFLVRQIICKCLITFTLRSLTRVCLVQTDYVLKYFICILWLGLLYKLDNSSLSR